MNLESVAFAVGAGLYAIIVGGFIIWKIIRKVRS